MEHSDILIDNRDNSIFTNVAQSCDEAIDNKNAKNYQKLDLDNVDSQIKSTFDTNELGDQTADNLNINMDVKDDDLNLPENADLYPKYWDFNNGTKFMEVSIDLNSQEGNEIKEKFIPSWNKPYIHKNCKVEVLKLTRIQNDNIMKPYVEEMAKMQKLNRPMTRRLLCHGTQTDLENFYHPDKTEVGFDVSHASKDGTFGAGIYFAGHSVYSHKYTGFKHNEKKTYKMIIADVFVGDTYQADSTKSVKNIHPDYDSLSTDDGCFRDFVVVYKNYRCYPLYVIEYTYDNGEFFSVSTYIR